MEKFWNKDELKALKRSGFLLDFDRTLIHENGHKIKKIKNNRYNLEVKYPKGYPYIGHSQPCCSFEKMLDIIGKTENLFRNKNVK